MAKKQILICDDDRDTIELMELSLNHNANVDVISVYTGMGVLDYLRAATTPPDLLIVDLMLPDVEGDDIIQIIRRSPEFSEIPIILMSGIIENVHDRARVVGANDFLTKPFALHDLQGKVEALI